MPYTRNGKTYHELTTAAEADALRDSIESIYEGWYAEAGRVDWEAFYDRLTDWTGWELVEDDSPADRRVRAIVKQLRAEG